MPKTKEAQGVLNILNDAPGKMKRRTSHKGNDLDGATWTRYSISVWNDIRKSAAEVKIGHPAMFPASLVDRLMDCFTTHEDKVILDPFLGSGSTIVAAAQGRKSRRRFRDLGRLHQARKAAAGSEQPFCEEPWSTESSRPTLVRFEKHVEPNSVRLVCYLASILGHPASKTKRGRKGAAELRRHSRRSREGFRLRGIPDGIEQGLHRRPESFEAWEILRREHHGSPEKGAVLPSAFRSRAADGGERMDLRRHPSFGTAVRNTTICGHSGIRSCSASTKSMSTS